MKQAYRKILSALLTVALLCGATVPAMASDALGEDLVRQEVLLNRQTTLSENVFWSTAFSDLRTEHYITYEPSKTVIPVVTSGEVLRDQSTVSASAKRLEEAG